VRDFPIFFSLKIEIFIVREHGKIAALCALSTMMKEKEARGAVARVTDERENPGVWLADTDLANESVAHS
jgi:hypothetical protein